MSLWTWLADRLIPAYAIHWCSGLDVICYQGRCCVHS